MIVRFWGVRGSTPTPSIANLKYGGNTPCVEVRTGGGQLIIMDAGTGIRALGKRLMAETPPEGHRIMLFISHYHWDHIQGIPFFEPMYAPGNFVYMHGFETAQASVEKALGEQMMTPYFPVDSSVMRATRHLYAVGEEVLQIGDAVVTTRFLNHPQGCLGYRVEADGHALVYATDNEHGSPVHDRNIRELAKNADMLIFDTQYTPEEYLSKQGWGHSTWEKGVEIAKEVGVRELVLFHHDPDHGDVFLDRMLEATRRCFPNTIAAMEGMEVDLSAGGAYRTAFEKRYAPRHTLSVPLVLRMGKSATKDERKVYVTSLSLDGAHFVSDSAMEIGSTFEAELEFPGQTGPGGGIKSVARVMRCEKLGDKFGIGVSFR